MALIFENTFFDVLTILLVLLTSVFWYFKYTFSYWQRRGIKHVPVSSPLGHFGPTFRQEISMGELTAKHHRSTTEPFIGLFACIRPMLLVRDPELIRHIFVKDFQHFVNRGVYSDEKRDPLSAHLFAMNGDKWKNLRAKLTPTFTSGKLKAMFPTLVACGDPLQKHLNEVASKTGIIDSREIAARYTTNSIASIAFGIDINCFDDPDTPFRKYVRGVFVKSWKNGIRTAGKFLFPKLRRILKIRSVDQETEDFMTSLVKRTLELREKNNIVRKDFFQLLLQLRNTGTVQKDGDWETTITADESGKTLNLAEMTAQAYIFYVAGFETTANTISFCLFELARNADAQRKVHEEIDEVLDKHNGELTYESLWEMKYLGNCIDETLRKYPPAPILNRECTQEYKLPGTDIVLEKGTAILISTMAIHRDEKYFPDPLKFDPNRFSDKDALHPMSYMPFGEGPRHCIAMRLGKLQARAAIVLMMQNCQFELGDTQYYDKEMELSSTSLSPTPTNGIQLRIRSR